VTQDTQSGPGDLAPGEQLGVYEIQQRIGRGGMAVVYRALDLRLGRLVALKVLAPHLGEDEAFRQRFMRESRAAAGVDHPHIIPVFEAGEAAGMLFIAMRYVAGGDVRSLIEAEGRLTPARTAKITSQVASALDAAHAHGLVHRDVKPANILLGQASGSDADHVYLSDFGLSKHAVSVSTLTSTGQFLGTLDYVAPEQIQGQKIDGRADQYGLACAVVEMLTGAPPFRRDDSMALMWAQLEAPPPRLTERRPELPAAVDAVIAAAMSKSPAGRYATCGDFAAALAAACGQHALQPSYADEGFQGDRYFDGRALADRSADVGIPPDRYADGRLRADRFAVDRVADGLADGGLGVAVNQADRYAADDLLAEPGSRQATPDPWSAPRDWFRGGDTIQAPEQAFGPGARARDGEGDGPVPVSGEPFRQPSVHAAWPAEPPPTRHEAITSPTRPRQPGTGQSGRGRPSRHRTRNIVIGLMITTVGLCGAAGIAYKLSHRSHPTTLPPVTVTETVAPPGPLGPAQTVREYFAAINHRRYLDAWRLRKPTEPYALFRAGFAGTLVDKVTILSVNGDVVTATLVAEQVNGNVKTYQGTYTVMNGIITATDVQRIS
jgi:serine/threonine-protein kinase